MDLLWISLQLGCTVGSYVVVELLWLRFGLWVFVVTVIEVLLAVALQDCVNCLSSDLFLEYLTLLPHCYKYLLT